MWIYTTDGMISVVADRNDRNLLQVRAREPIPLTEMFPGIRIIEHPNADYRYRVIVNREELAKVLCRIIVNMSYDNFKNQVGKEAPYLLATYYKVYNASLDLEDPYEGSTVVGPAPV